MTCSSEQIRLLMKYAQTNSQRVAAAKAGMSLSTAKRYLRMKGKKKQRSYKARTWRTREDPFAEVWPELQLLLERDSGLEAKTLMEWLLGVYPGRFKESQIRTLRRRIKDWRVLHGPETREVMFRQTIHPGRQSQSDYTHCNSLRVTIAGKEFPHMLYHFMLPYSCWEYVWICFTESYETLTTGYKSAVLVLGATAPEHRTDNLAAAVPIGRRHEFQTRWTNFLAHFGVVPSANNPRRSHENGSVEKSHDLFKHALDQRMRLRGSRDFSSIEEYERLLDVIVRDRNRQRADKVKEELKVLIPLPKGSWNEPKEFNSTVTPWSTISIEGTVYSVPSRFIGQRLRALVFQDRLQVMYGTHIVQEIERKPAGERVINYRHLIFHLMRKPGAFRNYQFRDELFPRKVFRQTYDILQEQLSEGADKEYLRILQLAAIENETEVTAALEILVLNQEVPTSEAVRRIVEKPKAIPEVDVDLPDLSAYDSLLTSANESDMEQIV